MATQAPPKEHRPATSRTACATTSSGGALGSASSDDLRSRAALRATAAVFWSALADASAMWLLTPPTRRVR